MSHWLIARYVKSQPPVGLLSCVYVHEQLGAALDQFGELGGVYTGWRVYEPIGADAARQVSQIERLERRLAAIAELIEGGDQRLLAADGAVGGQPPQLTLDEWRQIYEMAKGINPYDDPLAPASPTDGDDNA